MINLYDDNEKDKYFWSFVYFHGSLERYIAKHSDTEVIPDLVQSDIDLKTLKDGIYNCRVYNTFCKAYLWTDKHGIKKGLVVDITDNIAIQQAEYNYRNKSSII